MDETRAMSRPKTQCGLLLSIVAGFLISGCARTSSTNEADLLADSTGNVVAQVAVADSASADTVLTYEDIALGEELLPYSDSLRKYFNPSQVAMINRAAAEFKAIKSARELANFYQVTLRDSVQPMIERQFQAGCKHADHGSFADDDWDWVGDFLPAIGTRASCKELETGNECVHRAPISMLPLREAASRTPEPSDDLFFDAIIAIYTGSEPGGPIELMEVFDESEDYEPKQTLDCEQCVVSMLGDGYRGTIISKLASAASARRTFSNAVTEDLKYLFQDLKEEHYHYDKDKILSELDLIISKGRDSKLLTPRELASLEETRSWIQAKEEGFDCANRKCDFNKAPASP